MIIFFNPKPTQMKLSFPLPVVGMLISLWLAGCNGCQPNIPPPSATTATTSISLEDHPNNANVANQDCSMPNWSLLDTDFKVTVVILSLVEDPTAQNGFRVRVSDVEEFTRNEWQTSTAVTVPASGNYGFIVSIEVTECFTADCANFLCAGEGRSVYGGTAMFMDYDSISDVPMVHEDFICNC